MLSFANPAGLWLSLGLLPIIVFYFLRLRFRHQPIGSAFIWNKLAQQKTAGHRILWKSIILLCLQIAAVIIITAAASQPRWIDPGADKPGTVFIIDSSASMRCVTTPNGPSRFELAIDSLTKHLADLPPDSLVAVFLADTELHPLDFGQDRLWRASEAAQIIELAKRQTASWKGINETELSRGLQAWLSGKAPGWQGLFIGDGGTDLDGSKLSQTLNGALSFQLVGQGARDLGIGLAWLPQAGASSIDCSLINQGGTAVPVTLRVSAATQVFAEIRLSLPPGWSRQSIPLSKTLPPGAYTLALIPDGPQATPDDFPADDAYTLVVNPPRLINILHIGDSNPFLRAAFQGGANNFITIANWPASINPGDWDLIINENPKIPAGLRANFLSFASGPPDAPVEPGLPIAGNLESVSALHPLNRFVQWQKTRVQYGTSLAPEAEAQVLATCNQIPMIVTWEREGYSQTIVGCSLQDSAIGIAGAFPVFLRNIVQACVPQSDDSLADSLRAGEAKLRSEAPDWRSLDPKLTVKRVNANLVQISGDQPGLYSGNGANGQTQIAIRIPESELNLAPRQLPNLKRGLGPPIEANSDGQLSLPTNADLEAGSDLRHWTLLLAIILLALEWWLWQGTTGRRP